MSKKCKHGHEINPSHYLEIMDRLHVVISTIDEHIKQHPAVCYESDRLALFIDIALDNLMSAYQLAGRIEYHEFED